MSDSLTQFEPSKNQLAAVKAWQERDYAASVLEVCQEIGISRQAYYQWFDNEAFCDWWQGQADRWFALQRPRILAAIAAGATEDKPKGNPKDRELFLQRFDKGFMPKSKQEISATVDASINFESMTDDELKRIARASGITGCEEGLAGPVGTGETAPA
jgi:AcrR family transcriptional regulator